MDKKAQAILKHYKNKIESRSFDEYDILGFLIFIRKYIENNIGLETIHDFSNLIAHRKRDRGIALKAIENAIKNKYETMSKDMRVKDYNGIQYSEWEKEWYKLGEKFNIKFTDKIIYEITICVFSITQFTEYESEDRKYFGRIELFKSKRSMFLATTEGKDNSLYINFFILPINSSQKLEKEKFHPVLEPIETIRIDGELKIREEKIIKEKFAQLISKRLSLEINDDFGLEEVWEKEISILTENLDKTISYILNDCPDEEFYWMSEVFEEIVQKVQSMDFINAIKERLKKVTNEKYYKDIEQEIEDAIDYLE